MPLRNRGVAMSEELRITLLVDFFGRDRVEAAPFLRMWARWDRLNSEFRIKENDSL